MIRNYIFHSICYYLSWVVCILLASRGYQLLAPVSMLSVLMLQMMWYGHNHHNYSELLLYMFTFLILGTMVDSLLMHARFINFNANAFSPLLSAPWVMALWLSLAFNFYVLFKAWFKHFILCGILALIGFPIAYRAGVAIGAASVSSPYFYLIIGLVWGGLFPIINSLFKNNVINE